MSSSPPVLSSHPLLFVRFCLPPPMPSLSRRSASPLQSEGTGEFNSNSFWTDCSAISTLQEGSPLFEGLPMIFEANNLPTIPIDNFPPSDRGPPPVPPEDFESVKATIGYNIPFGIQPEDLCVIPLQSLTTANHNSTPPCSLNPIHQTAVQYGLSTLSTATDGLACTHLVSAPVYPWAPAAYLQFLNNNPQTPPPPTTKVLRRSQPTFPSRPSSATALGLRKTPTTLLHPNLRRPPPLLVLWGAFTLIGVASPVITSSVKMLPYSSTRYLAPGAPSLDATTPRWTGAPPTSSATLKLMVVG